MNGNQASARTQTVPFAPKHWKLTAEQYQRIGETGILGEDDRVELLEGELYEMAPIGDWHNGGVNSLNWQLNAGVGSRAIVQSQGSFRLSEDAEPEPDILVLRFRDDFYRSRLARPEDVLLLVEVADTSLAYDREFKLPLYARARIPEVWIVNRAGLKIEVYREPEGDSYRSVTLVGRAGTVTPLAFPDLSISVMQIVG